MMLNTCGLFVTLIDSCNLNCEFCPFPERPGFRTGKELDYDKFIAILRGLRDCPPPIPLGAVCYCGSSEPLLYKRVTELVAETTKIVPQVSLVTNGVLLTEKTADELLCAGINHIVISMTGNSADVYSHYQGSGKSLPQVIEQWQLVRNNVGNLVRMRDKMRAVTQIGISYILHHDTKNDLLAALFHWRELGVNYVDVRILNEGFTFPKDDYRTYIEAVVKKLGENYNYCTCFGKVMNVSTDGTLGFCNCAYLPETQLGNIFETPLQQILSSERFTSLAQSFSRDYDNVPEYCKTCDLGRSRPILA
jgi:radical SAM protein with 4Fe4S-binding SPASM domain